jgi:hypothetical protein
MLHAMKKKYNKNYMGNNKIIKKSGKKSLVRRFLEWIIKGNTKAAAKGSLCKS